MTIAEKLVQIIKNIGIRHVVGVPGSYVLPLYEALRKEKEITLVLLHDENTAGIIADGYYKACGKPIACVATAGPGAVRLADGLYVPRLEKSSVFAITGMPPVALLGKGALQEATGGYFPSQSIYLNESCSYCDVVTSAGEFAPKIEQALLHLHNSPGSPVNLTFPIDVLTSQHTGDDFDCENIKKGDTHTALANNAINAILKKVASSKRPLIVAGGGISHGYSYEYVKEFVETTGIPLATTLRAKGIMDELHPLALGCVGMYGQNTANRYVLESDLIVALGVSFSEMTTQCWNEELFAGSKMIHVDLDERVLHRNFSAATSLQINAVHFLKKLNEAGITQRNDLIKRVAKLKKRYHYFERNENHSQPLEPTEVMDELRNHLNEDTIVVTESITWTERSLPLRYPGNYIVDGNAATLGYGAAALGVKMAKQDAKVIALVGDGGFRYSIGTLEISRTHNIPVIWLILNNACYASIKDAQKSLFGKVVCAEFDKKTDLAMIARGFGVRGISVENREQLRNSLTEALESNETCVIDIKVSDATPPYKPGMIQTLSHWGLKPVLSTHALTQLGKSKGEV